MFDVVYVMMLQHMAQEIGDEHDYMEARRRNVYGIRYSVFLLRKHDIAMNMNNF